MTSFTRKLYRTDPAAYAAFERARRYERQIVMGKTPTLACFTPAFHGLHPSFGKRQNAPLGACAASCGHPACKDGCTLIGRMG